MSLISLQKENQQIESEIFQSIKKSVSQTEKFKLKEEKLLGDDSNSIQQKERKTTKRGRPTLYLTPKERYQKKLERDRRNQKSYRFRKTNEIRQIIELNQQLKKQNSILRKKLQKRDLSLKKTAQSLYEKFLEKVKQLEKLVKENQFTLIEKGIQQMQQQLCNNIKTFSAKAKIDVDHYYKLIQKEIQSIESKIMIDLASPEFIDTFNKTRAQNNNKFIKNYSSCNKFDGKDNIGKEFNHIDFLHSLKLSQQQVNFAIGIFESPMLQQMRNGIKLVENNMKKLFNDLNLADIYLSKRFHEFKTILHTNQKVQLYSYYDRIKHFYYPEINNL